MTIAIVPNAPERASEREAGPTTGRRQDRAAFADAFGGEIRRAEKKAQSAAGAGEKAESEEAEAKAAADAAPASEAAKPAEDGATGGATRDVLGLLAAAAETVIAAREAKTAVDTDRPRAAPSLPVVDGEVAAKSGEIDAPRPATGEAAPIERANARAAAASAMAMPAAGETMLLPDTDALPVTGTLRPDDALGAPRVAVSMGAETVPARGRARLEIVHQETHFEPTMREAVMVEKSTADAPQRAPTRGEELLQMLSGRPSGPRDPAANAQSSPGPNGASGERAERATRRDPERAMAAPIAAATAGAGNASPASVPVPVALQVASRIVDAFQPLAAPDRPVDHPASEAHLRLRAGGAALKTLTIQLQPEHLGTVHISMRMQEGQLTLELAASRADTARVLMEDRAGLKALLEKAGFSLDEAAIHIVARDVSAPQSPNPGGREPQADGARGADRFADPEGNGREGRSQDDAERRRPGAAAGPQRAETAPPGGHRAGSVFL